jgi:hypothetical protein
MADVAATVVPALGTTIALKIAAAYVPLCEVTELGGPESAIGEVSTTTLCSPIKTTRPTLLDPGTVSFSLNFDPASTNHMLLLTNFAAKVTSDWQISFPTTPKATLASFSGFITKATPNAGGEEENLTLAVEVRVNSTIVWTAAP